ncbi:MAG: 3-hydroxyacyl-CoA dehydrogenase [Linnemannia gamsii]|nr:MAG: 3-hydroxyacyl-CoA dehydrogenase [Linnemannia gamsii]
MAFALARAASSHASHWSVKSFHSSSTSLHGVKHVGVLGAGQMGLGIALVAANVAKLPVLLLDSNEAQLSKGLKFMDSLLKKDIAKGRLTEAQADETRSRVKTTSKMADFGNVDFVIEAVSENPALKANLFRDLAQATPKHAILASNTSSISITKIAAAAKGREEQVIGMHFMNPVPVMKLVEIIPGLATSNEVLRTTKDLAVAMGKTCTVSQDVPGFVANRLLMPYINEAIIAYETGIASKEDIDTTMKLGTNMPMGPLTLADFIGLDTCLAIMKVLHEQLGDTKYRPSVLLNKMVDAGWVGKKSGRGFYVY